ncbi:MAG TPA: hypothetical protein PLA46_10275 [Phycicoccus sp.]|nr:hypothetical protein [Phycicoccus sp.]
MATPDIASRGRVTGGRHDGAEGALVSSDDALLMVVCYERDGQMVTDLRGSLSRPAAAYVLRELAAQLDPKSTDQEHDQ